MELSRVSQSAFDQEASQYDAHFTHSKIGIYQRKRVHHFLNTVQFFKQQKKVFEINCGTGYDAEQFTRRGHHVVATDASKAMVQVAKDARSSDIQFYPLSFEQVPNNQDFQQAEVLFSNFGGLNCLSGHSLSQFIQRMALQQDSGKQLVLVIMAKKCLWENIYFAFKGKKDKIGRRNTNDALKVNVSGEVVETYYHSPDELKSHLSNDYHITLLRPIAFFLPPSYLESFFKKQKRFLWVLHKLEQVFGRFETLASWSDHYLIIANRK